VTGAVGEFLQVGVDEEGPDFQGERLVVGCGTTFEHAILQCGCLVHRHGGVEIAVELSRVALVR